MVKKDGKKISQRGELKSLDIDSLLPLYLSFILLFLSCSLLPFVFYVSRMKKINTFGLPHISVLKSGKVSVERVYGFIVDIVRSSLRSSLRGLVRVVVVDLGVPTADVVNMVSCLRWISWPWD